MFFFHIFYSQFFNSFFQVKFPLSVINCFQFNFLTIHNWEISLFDFFKNKTALYEKNHVPKSTQSHRTECYHTVKKTKSRFNEERMCKVETRELKQKTR